MSFSAAIICGQTFYFIKDINHNFRPKVESLITAREHQPLVKLIENNISDDELLDELCKLT